MSAAKLIKDLKIGETFIDSLGLELTVVSIQDLPFSGITRTSPKVKMAFKTQSGREMFQNFRANRMVTIK